MVHPPANSADSWPGLQISPAEVEGSRLRTEAGALGVRLSDDQAEQLIRYVALLERWNARFNLISRRDIDRIWPRHILDSLSVAGFVQPDRDPVAADGTVFDIGTGAGLPGLPLAIALPQLNWLLLDRNQRKIRFLEMVIGELGLVNAAARAVDLGARIRDDELLAGADTIVSRAVDGPTGLLPLAEPLLKPAGRLVLMTATAAMDGDRADAEPPLSSTRPGAVGTDMGAGFFVSEVHEVSIPGLDRSHEVTIIERVDQRARH